MCEVFSFFKFFFMPREEPPFPPTADGGGALAMDDKSVVWSR